MSEPSVLAFVKRDLKYFGVPEPENLRTIVTSTLDWVHDWFRETAGAGECNCQRCFLEMINEVRDGDVRSDDDNRAPA